MSGKNTMKEKRLKQHPDKYWSGWRVRVKLRWQGDVFSFRCTTIRWKCSQCLSKIPYNQWPHGHENICKIRKLPQCMAVCLSVCVCADDRHRSLCLNVPHHFRAWLMAMFNMTQMPFLHNPLIFASLSATPLDTLSVFQFLSQSFTVFPPTGHI